MICTCYSEIEDVDLAEDDCYVLLCSPLRLHFKIFFIVRVALFPSMKYFHFSTRSGIGINKKYSKKFFFADEHNIIATTSINIRDGCELSLHRAKIYSIQYRLLLLINELKYCRFLEPT